MQLLRLPIPHNIWPPRAEAQSTALATFRRRRGGAPFGSVHLHSFPLGPKTLSLVKKRHRVQAAATSDRSNGIPTFTKKDWELLRDNGNVILEFPDVEFPQKHSPLKHGDENRNVVLLQEYLRRTGHFASNTKATGYFGEMTEEALINWQMEHGLLPTGTFDRESRKKYLNLMAKRLNELRRASGRITKKETTMVTTTGLPFFRVREPSLTQVGLMVFTMVTGIGVVGMGVYLWWERRMEGKVQAHLEAVRQADSRAESRKRFLARVKNIIDDDRPIKDLESESQPVAKEVEKEPRGR